MQTFNSKEMVEFDRTSKINVDGWYEPIEINWTVKGTASTAMVHFEIKGHNFYFAPVRLLDIYEKYSNEVDMFFIDVMINLKHDVLWIAENIPAGFETQYTNKYEQFYHKIIIEE